MPEANNDFVMVEYRNSTIADILVVLIKTIRTEATRTEYSCLTFSAILFGIKSVFTPYWIRSCVAIP